MKTRFRNIINDWSNLGKEDLLWSVLSEDDKRNSKWNEEEFYQTGQNEVRRLMTFAGGNNLKLEGRAMDFGCGVGRLTFGLATYFEQVIGVDISESALSKARQVNQFPQIVTFIENQTLDLDILEDESLDFILSLITFQHNPRPIVEIFLKEFSRILKPDAMLCFQIPSHRVDRGLGRWLGETMPSGLKKWVFRNVLNKREGFMEMHGWQQEKLIKFMDGIGLDLIRVQPDDRAGVAWASFTYWFRKRPSGQT